MKLRRTRTATSVWASTLLGAAAGFVMVTSAAAGDLAQKAEPVQFMKICVLDGHSYFYIPGNDACSKNSLSLTVGSEERRSKSLMSLSPDGAPRMGDRPGEVWPDPFISLRTDQSWGYGALVGGARNFNGSYSGDNSVLATANGFNACLQSGASDCGRLGDKPGFFLGLGGEVKAPLLGPGDRIGAGIRYSQGASTGFGGALNMPGPDLFGAGGNPAMGWMPDNGSGLELTKAWSVQAGYDHQWSRSLNTSLFANYSNVTFDGQSANAFTSACPTGAAAAPGGLAASCKSTWGNVGVGARTSWAPASGLTLSVQTMYNNGFGGAPTVRPTEPSSFANQGVWSSYLRLDHSFNTGE